MDVFSVYKFYTKHISIWTVLKDEAKYEYIYSKLGAGIPQSV